MLGRIWSALRTRWEAAFPTSRRSIIRPSLVGVALFLAGHVLYYVFLLGANQVLDQQGFGRFYAAWSTINVITAPGTFLAMFLTGYLAGVFRASGEAATLAALGRVVRASAGWALAALALAEAGLCIAGVVAGVESLLLVSLLPLAAFSIIVIEVIRAAFQSMLRFFWSGACWCVSCAARCLIGLSGLALIGAPWAGIAGIVGANVLLTPALAKLLVREAANAKLPSPPPTTVILEPAAPPLRHVLPYCTAFAGFVILANADVLLAYTIMSGWDLGIYAAAALLPKAIVTATYPLAQTTLPVLINNQDEQRRIHRIILKATMLAFAMGVAGLAVLWVGSDLVCGGRFGIRFCEPSLMLLLATASIPLAVTRTLMTADIALRRYLLAHLPLLALAAFLVAGIVWRPSAMGLAGLFVGAAWTLVALVAAVRLATLAAERADTPGRAQSPPR